MSKSKPLTKQEFEEAQEAFNFYDGNNDGLIHLDELRQALNALGYNPRNLEELANNYDEDGEGSVSFEGFRKIIETELNIEKDKTNLSEAIKALDWEEDSTISTEALR